MSVNPISYALSQVRHKIPKPILELTFDEQQHLSPRMAWSQHHQQGASLDFNIRSKVIEERVNVDCNLIGGIEVAVDLTNAAREVYDEFTTVYRIPLERTQNLPLVSASMVCYLRVDHYRNIHNTSGSPTVNALYGLMRSNVGRSIYTTTNIRILGENTILVRDDGRLVRDHRYLLGKVANDPNMNNLVGKALKAYAELVIRATKAYIYNNISIPIDQGQLHAGMELGRIREIVDGYSDADELYEEYYEEVWQKVSMMNDRPRMDRWINSMVGNGFS